MSRDVRPTSDRGSATVLVVTAIGVVLLLMTGALALLSAVGASHRARAAADLAALAAAQVLVTSANARDPCEVASGVAARNESEVVACDVAGAEIVVTVTVSPSWPGLGDAVARARAGPEPVRGVAAGAP